VTWQSYSSALSEQPVRTERKTNDWFPNGGGGDDRIYAAMIVGAVGIIQLLGLHLTTPEATD